MFPLTVSETVQALRGVLVVGDPQSSFGSGVPAARGEGEAPAWPPPGVSIDTRTLRRGDVFFALKGGRVDGHQFLNEAIRKGAALCVVSQVPSGLNINLAPAARVVKVKDTKKALADFARHYRRRHGAGARVAGITGSCGKTTVKEMVVQVLARLAPTAYSPGNYNNEIGCPIALLGLEPGTRFGVFEMGSSARGEVRRLAEVVQPLAAVVTNVQLEHTATFGSLENIAEGESEALPFLPKEGCAVLPREDGFFDFMKSRVPAGVRVESFGFSPEASVRVEEWAAWPGPTRYKLAYRDAAGKVIARLEGTLPVMGRFNVLNACAAAAVCLGLGVEPAAIVEGLAHFAPPKMRFQVQRLNGDVTLVNDSYNANPGSMRQSLESFVECFPDKRRLLVLGDMLELGEISRKEHADLGKFVAGLSVSKVYLLGPQTKFTAQGAREALMNEGSIAHFSDPDALLRELKPALAPGTAVLFKASRGMQLDQVVRKILP